MKNKYTSLIIIPILISFYACNNTSNTETQTQTQTVKISNQATLELFWETFQTAVANRDMETLESLYAPEASFRKFGNMEYREKIAKGKASDITATGETYKDRKVYQFAMIFPPETVSEDEENEESMTAIYIWKNNKEEYEIFNVLEAG